MAAGRADMAEAQISNPPCVHAKSIVSDDDDQLIIVKPGYDTPINRLNPHEKVGYEDTYIRVWHGAEMHKYPAFAHKHALEGAFEIF